MVYAFLVGLYVLAGRGMTTSASRITRETEIQSTYAHLATSCAKIFENFLEEEISRTALAVVFKAIKTQASAKTALTLSLLLAESA